MLCSMIAPFVHAFEKEYNFDGRSGMYYRIQVLDENAFIPDDTLMSFSLSKEAFFANKLNDSAVIRSLVGKTVRLDGDYTTNQGVKTFRVNSITFQDKTS